MDRKLLKTVQTITTFRNRLADPRGTRRGPPLVRGPQFENRWAKSTRSRPPAGQGSHARGAPSLRGCSKHDCRPTTRPGWGGHAGCDQAHRSCRTLPMNTYIKTDKTRKLLSIEDRFDRVVILRSPHTHPFNGPFSGTTQVSRYQRDRTNLDFIEARNSQWQ